MFVMLTMSLASGKRVAGVLNEKSTLANPENPVYEVKDGSIEFDNVSFSYNTKAEKPILNDINLKNQIRRNNRYYRRYGFFKNKPCKPYCKTL